MWRPISLVSQVQEGYFAVFRNAPVFAECIIVLLLALFQTLYFRLRYFVPTVKGACFRRAHITSARSYNTRDALKESSTLATGANTR